MTIILNLTEDEETNLLASAAQAGVDAERYLHMLISGAKAAGSEMPKTPADAVAYWKSKGVLGSYGDPDIDSVELARLLRHQAEARQ